MANNVYLAPSPVVPGALLISNITQTNPMVVTIINSIYNSYSRGQQVKLSVPSSYGMTQANNLTGTIINISGTNFTLDINATQFDAFIAPGASPPFSVEPASLSPSGSKNIYNITTAPFRSLNGQEGN